MTSPTPILTMEAESNKNTGLSSQPPELIDYICYFLLRPQDILAFALTSKQVYSVAVPHHINSRHLRCDFRRIRTWRTLANNPALASRFAILEIINEGDDGKPDNIESDDNESEDDESDESESDADELSNDQPDNDQPGDGEPDDDESEQMFFNWWPMYTGSEEDAELADLESNGLDENVDNVKKELKRHSHKILSAIRICMRAFAAALQCMTGLTRFHWLLRHISPGPDIIDALLKCPSIEDVDIVGIGGWFPGIVIDKGLAVHGVCLSSSNWGFIEI